MAALNRFLSIWPCGLVAAIPLVLSAATLPSPSPLKISRQLEQYAKNISTLKKEIQSLEKQLGDTNKRYLTVLQRRKAIDQLMAQQKKRLQENLTNIKNQRTKTKKFLRLLVVHSIKKSGENLGEMLSGKVLQTSLRTELANLAKSQKINKKLSQEVALLNQKYREYLDIEEGILNLLEDWRGHKREKTSTYRSQVNKMKSIQKEHIFPKRPSKKISTGRLFRNPIDRYYRLKYGKKGVTYYVRKYQKIKNASPGKIVYSDKLSTFGNVLMVDHGNELRSIFLGQFVPTLKKGTPIGRGDVLGYAKANKGREAKIYFEVRKKNKAQNTIHFLDREALSKAKVRAATTES